MSVYPANRNRPDLERLGLWTNEQYNELDPVIRRTIKDTIEQITDAEGREHPMRGPDNTPGEATSYSWILRILENATSHPSNTVRRNLTLVGSGLDTGSTYLDDGTDCDDGYQDPELDVDGSRLSKFRIVEAILKEAEQLGNKEFKSVIYYLEIILASMRDVLRCWRLEWGWDDRRMQFGPPHQGCVPTLEKFLQDHFPQ